jgi:hypothetical protein
LWPTTIVVEEVQSLSDNPSGSYSSLVSQHSNSSLVDTTVILMQYSVDTTPFLRSGASFDHVINISSLVPYEQESVPCSLSMLPPSPREVSFDWDGLVGYQIPSSKPFHIRGVLRYIVEKVTSVIILSSSTWKALGFPKLVSVVRKLLNFHRSPAWETCPPP